MRVARPENIFRALNEANVRYIVVGGLTGVAHGFVRVMKEAVGRPQDLEDVRRLRIPAKGGNP